MKKFIYSLLFVSFAITVQAQVTIGSLDTPQRGAVLELKSDTLGFLPPRVMLAGLSKPDPLPIHVEGMVVFNTKVSAADTLQAGLYYNSGTRWIRLSTTPYSTQNWYYMPSIVFDTSTKGTNLIKDLYQEFKTQLNTAGGLVKYSNGAPAQVLTNIPAANNLHYYVTAYDDEVFSNISIDVNGVMTYDIIGTATDATFINVVFVEK